MNEKAIPKQTKTPTNEIIVALTGTRMLFSSEFPESLEDFQGTSLTCPGPMDWFRFFKNLISKVSYPMPMAKTKTTLMVWNIGIIGHCSFSMVIPAQVEAPEGIPKYEIR